MTDAKCLDEFDEFGNHWLITNPNWPSGDGSYRERCSGCEKCEPTEPRVVRRVEVTVPDGMTTAEFLDWIAEIKPLSVQLEGVRHAREAMDRIFNRDA